MLNNLDYWKTSVWNKKTSVAVWFKFLNKMSEIYFKCRRLLINKFLLIFKEHKL